MQKLGIFPKWVLWMRHLASIGEVDECVAILSHQAVIFKLLQTFFCIIFLNFLCFQFAFFLVVLVGGESKNQGTVYLFNSTTARYGSVCDTYWTLDNVSLTLIGCLWMSWWHKGSIFQKLEVEKIILMRFWEPFFIFGTRGHCYQSTDFFA